MSESFEEFSKRFERELVNKTKKQACKSVFRFQQKKIDELRKELEEKSATIRKYMNESGEYWRQVESLTRCECFSEEARLTHNLPNCRPCQNKQQIENMESEK